jgi:hypothetical protein
MFEYRQVGRSEGNDYARSQTISAGVAYKTDRLRGKPAAIPGSLFANHHLRLIAFRIWWIRRDDNRRLRRQVELA